LRRHANEGHLGALPGLAPSGGERLQNRVLTHRRAGCPREPVAPARRLGQSRRGRAHRDDPAWRCQPNRFQDASSWLRIPNLAESGFTPWQLFGLLRKTPHRPKRSHELRIRGWTVWGVNSSYKGVIQCFLKKRSEADECRQIGEGVAHDEPRITGRHDAALLELLDDIADAGPDTRSDRTGDDTTHCCPGNHPLLSFVHIRAAREYQQGSA